MHYIKGIQLFISTIILNMMRKNGSESSTSSTSSAFEEEIINGLLSKPKTLPSKYFYDEKGDVLF